MKLTKEKAIELHREMWNWLADNPTCCKSEWPGFDGIEERPPARCWACQYAINTSGSCSGVARCASCPFVWPVLPEIISHGDCLCSHSYYHHWENAENAEAHAYLARKIANLSVKGEAEDKDKKHTDQLIARVEEGMDQVVYSIQALKVELATTTSWVDRTKVRLLELKKENTNGKSEGDQGNAETRT